MRRLIALGASNLTRGLHVVVQTARQSSGEPLEVFAALGHGRSYGRRSHFLARALPGIIESGLWRALEGRERAPTTALVTDIGNDVLYGAEPELILAWVDSCLTRLRALDARVVMTDLPVFSAQRLSETAFTVFRSVVVPGCRLSLPEVAQRARAVNDGVVSLGARHGAVIVRLRPEWYGRDPIHMLPRHWRAAWQEIVLAGEAARRPPAIGWSLAAWLRLYLARPEQRWLLGFEQRRAQPALRLGAGTTVWLY
jgi:hypothetical protein